MHGILLSVCAFSFASQLVAQSWHLDASVRASSLSVNCSGQRQNAALPAGPVTAPISARATFATTDARSAITPQTATMPLAIEFGVSAFGSIPGCGFGAIASGTLGVDLTLTSTAPGRHWLRVIWEGNNVGSGVWVLRAPGFQWQEIRSTQELGYPPYVDVLVDLTQSQSLTVDYQSTLTGGISQGMPWGYGVGGRMTFGLRAMPPMQQEIWGAPCLSRTSQVPAAVAYDPFGLPGRIDIEVACANYMRAPLLLACLGDSRERFGSIPLPLDLGPIGAPGCSLFTNIVTVIPGSTRTNFSFLALGPEPALRGLGPIYCQWIAVDGANALGMIFSNGVRVEVP